jgi:hypothetical protein
VILAGAACCDDDADAAARGALEIAAWYVLLIADAEEHV